VPRQASVQCGNGQGVVDSGAAVRRPQFQRRVFG
jgi:hypothetical protein